MSKASIISLLTASAVLAGLTPLVAQKVYTDGDYARAERWMSYNTRALVQGTVSEPKYLPDGRVFFATSDGGGEQYHLADPKTGAVKPAFDQAKLAEALSKASGAKVNSLFLNVESYTPEAGGGFAVETRGGTFHCGANAATCHAETPEPVQHPAQKPDAQPPAQGNAASNTGNAQMTASAQKAQKPTQPIKPVGRSTAPFDMSPDKTMQAFIRADNLWVRTVKTGEERQLTTDGVKDFGYATDNAGWTHSDAPIVVWSPDSKQIATFQQDQRNDGMMYLLSVTDRHPELEAWRYPFLGDKNVTMIERVVIDVPTGKVVRLKTPRDEHRSTLCDDVSCRGGAGWDDVKWAADGKSLAFVSTSRDHKDEWLRVADTATGDVRTVYHEHVPTYYESGQGKVNWSYLPETNEFLWYSERSDFGQMYLYDLKTGKLKNEVTHGDGPVNQVLHVDAKGRVLYFIATGKEAGQDPYFEHYYRVKFDGSGQELLTPEDANHDVTPSADGATFVDVYSTPTEPQTTVLRDNTGKMLATLAKQDISQLKAAGWKPVTPITVKARDGKTPLYGFEWRPTEFDPAKKYPVVVYIYPGPQVGSCPTHDFHASSGDNNALAELGFAVVCIDSMGTPLRSKSFHDAYAHTPAEVEQGTIPDQIAGLQDLATREPWLDLTRVGIWGHSGGGFASTAAMLHHPEFFKVGWSESGNHDQRDYEDDWMEKYAGLEVLGPNDADNYRKAANQEYAGDLKGHLMLVHGTSDDNVPENNTLMVVDALIKANKNFDLIMVPNAHHGYGAASQYVMRRRWDYFVKNLAGGTPPDEYKMKSYGDVIKAIYGPSASSDDGSQ